MTALVQLREAPLIAFSDDIIDYEEFLILYELNISREICPIVFLINSIYLLGMKHFHVVLVIQPGYLGKSSRTLYTI